MGRYPTPQTPQEDYDARERRFVEAIYSARYHRKNREERNRKTRLRMATLRAQDATLPPEQLAARRASAKKYREQNKWKIAKKAREARRSAKEERQTATSSYPSEGAVPARREMSEGTRQEMETSWLANEAIAAARQREWALQGRIAWLHRERAAGESYMEHLACGPCLSGTVGHGDLHRGEFFTTMDYSTVNAFNAMPDSDSDGTPGLDPPDSQDSQDFQRTAWFFPEFYDSDNDSCSEEPTDCKRTSLTAAYLAACRQQRAIQRMREQEALRREETRRVHAEGFVTPGEFYDMVQMYLDDDLELHMGFEWLQTNWVRTFTTVLHLALFLDYGQKAIWGVTSDDMLPGWACRFPWLHDFYVAEHY
ncbi:hypothetical protein C8R43DRAFT_965544 [Mycena crocata]|nr:hypothetical protein C8R43DRAFT_965544 [Mycena crocata]